MENEPGFDLPERAVQLRASMEGYTRQYGAQEVLTENEKFARSLGSTTEELDELFNPKFPVSLDRAARRITLKLRLRQAFGR